MADKNEEKHPEKMETKEGIYIEQGKILIVSIFGAREFNLNKIGIKFQQTLSEEKFSEVAAHHLFSIIDLERDIK